MSDYYLKPKDGGPVIRVSAEKLVNYQATRKYETATKAEFDAQRQKELDAQTAAKQKENKQDETKTGDGLDGLGKPELKTIAKEETGDDRGTKDELKARIRQARAEKVAAGDGGGSDGEGAGVPLESLDDAALVERAKSLELETEGKSRDELISAITDKLAELSDD